MREEKTWYRCDPEKNKECRKRTCGLYGGPCIRTSKEEYAKLDTDGKPIIEPGLRELRGKEHGTD
jgi:hypothetical protein